jgi:hypothetical protein
VNLNFPKSVEINEMVPGSGDFIFFFNLDISDGGK